MEDLEDWQTKKATIRERAEVLFKTQDLSDCEFLVGPDKVKVPSHKLFLAISSPVFYAMFFGEMAEKESVEIKDIDAEAFRGMLQFIYTDHVDFESCTHACSIFSAATKYMLPFLEEYCLNYLKDNVTADSACELFEFATFHDNTEIRKMCLEVFQENTSDVLKSAGFIEADFSTVLTIFEQEKLELDSELELFTGLKAWTDAEVARLDVPLESYCMSVSEALSKIKFLKLTAEEFAGGPGLSPLLTKDEQLAIALNITKPGVIEIPDRINPETGPRRVVEAPVPVTPPLEWSLERVVSDNIVYPVTRWVNPFPRKGLTVSRSIRLKGVKISSQRVSFSSEQKEAITYKENVTVVLKKDWAVKFSGAKFMEETEYNSSFTVSFYKPVMIEAGKKYWVIVQFDKNGDYLFTRDKSSTYMIHDNKIELYEEFSPITEFLFCENPESSH